MARELSAASGSLATPNILIIPIDDADRTNDVPVRRPSTSSYVRRPSTSSCGPKCTASALELYHQSLESLQSIRKPSITDEGLKIRKISDLRVSQSNENLRRDSVRVSNANMASFISQHIVNELSKTEPLKERHQTTRGNSPIENKILIESLKALMKLVVPMEKTQVLTVDTFKAHLKQFLDGKGGAEDYQIDELLMKIDCMSSGKVKFEDLCHHLMYQMAHKARTEKGKAGAYVNLPPKFAFVPHRDSIVKVNALPYGSFITCSQDGTITLWSGDMVLEQTKQIGAYIKSMKHKWLICTNCGLMMQYNKIVILTADRKIQFYDFTSFEPYCQITDLDGVPLTLHFSVTGVDSCILAVGDTDGCVSALVFNATHEVLRRWKSNPKFRGLIPSISLDNAAKTKDVRFVTWKVHHEWVKQVGYIKSMNRLVSCANDDITSLVIGCMFEPSYITMQRKKTPQPHEIWKPSRNSHLKYRRHTSEQRIFSVYKGVQCFDHSQKLELIVTGGQDRKIRLWNLYINKKFSSILQGHFAPITFLSISEMDHRLYSISSDKCIKVWDLLNEMCVQTISEKGHGLHGAFLDATYCRTTQVMCLAMEYKIGAICFKSPQIGKVGDARVPVSHRYAVQCVKYNKCLKQVVSCSANSTVKIWEYVDGTCLFKFTHAHGFASINCMMFDTSNRRLITGGQDGCMKLWNFNTGQCLRVMKRMEGNMPLAACTNVTVYKNNYAVAVGWDRLVHFYAIKDSDHVNLVDNPVYSRPEKKRLIAKEDLMAVSQCGNHLLATASADGKINIWNLVSGNIMATLNPPSVSIYKDSNLEKDMCVKWLLWLKHGDPDDPKTVTLIASGPHAHVHLWNIQGASNHLLGQFNACPGGDAAVSAAIVNEQEHYLFTGSSNGYISIWDLIRCCGSLATERMFHWRGHVESVTCLELIENENIMISASNDCTLRMWTLSGDYIGVFGQAKPWDIADPSTFSHPLIPQDVLLDPFSMPLHPVIAMREDPYTVIHEESQSCLIASTSSNNRDVKEIASTFQASNVKLLTDSDINDALKEIPMSSNGLRLRNERNKRVVPPRIGPSEYQHIHYHNLSSTCAIQKPSLQV